jgi:hypothetical protein
MLATNNQDKNSHKATGNTEMTSDSRKPYKSPKLQVFGKLSRLTHGSAGPNGDGKGSKQTNKDMGKGGGKGKGSDRRLKQNIVHVCVLGNGLNLYLFDYINPSCAVELGRQLGVMADEVANVMPEAVSTSPAGFKMVDYGLLDIQPADFVASLDD